MLRGQPGVRTMTMIHLVSQQEVNRMTQLMILLPFLNPTNQKGDIHELRFDQSGNLKIDSHSLINSRIEGAVFMV